MRKIFQKIYSNLVIFNLPKLVVAPNLPKNLPGQAKWLSGEGAGSWFVVEKIIENQFQVSRYSPDGKIECKNTFQSNRLFNPIQEYEITYPSHCAKVTILQSDSTIVLLPITQLY